MRTSIATSMAFIYTQSRWSCSKPKIELEVSKVTHSKVNVSAAMEAAIASCLSQPLRDFYRTILRL